VAAAIFGGSAVSEIGTLISGGAAAKATEQATQAAVAEQQAALAQQANLSAPYRALGSAAIPLYQQLLGLGPGGSSGIISALQKTPGYQFAQQEGQTGIVNAASANGGISGNTLASLDEFNTGLAEGTYQSVLGDVQGAVGLGQAAAAGQASNIGTAAGNISNLVAQQGQTMAGIDANTIAGLTKAAGSGIQNYETLQALQALENPGGGGGASPESDIYGFAAQGGY
jgi:hypothetical protein